MAEDNYKRIEDQKWRERVDERLASLTSGENVQDDRLDSGDEEIHAIREILEGKDNDKDDSGLKGDVHDLAVKLNRLYALMAPDQLGNGGVLNRLKALEKREEREQRSSEYHWKFWITAVGFASATTVAVITNLDHIRAFFERKAKSTDPVEQMIEKAHRSKRKTRHIVVHEEPADDAPAQEVP